MILWTSSDIKQKKFEDTEVDKKLIKETKIFLISILIQ